MCANYPEELAKKRSILIFLGKTFMRHLYATRSPKNAGLFAYRNDSENVFEIVLVTAHLSPPSKSSLTSTF